jgi:hypothetical protein
MQTRSQTLNETRSQTRSQTLNETLNETRSQTRSQTLNETRSQTLNKTHSRIINETLNQFAVDIDFDGASRAWTANKKKLANGCFTYVCGATLKNGNFCKNKSCSKHKHNLRNFE